MGKCFRQYAICALFYCMQLFGEETVQEQGDASNYVEEDGGIIGVAEAFIGDVISNTIATVPISNPSTVMSPATVTMTLPIGWRLAEKNPQTPHVELMVVGTGRGAYPPSINLVVERYAGTMKEYLKEVKAYNATQHSRWRDLGKLCTASGDAHLSQLDFNSRWGSERMMHVMLLKDGYMYIVTAAALKDEFADHYREFFAAFRSLQIQSPQPQSQ